MASSKLLSGRQLMSRPITESLKSHAIKRIFFSNEILQNPSSQCWKRVISSQYSSLRNISTKTSTKYLATSWRTLSTQTSKKSNLGTKLKTFLKTTLKVIFGSVLIIVGAGGLYVAKVAYIEEDIEPIVSEGPRSPTRKSHITKEWLEYVLTKYEEKNTEGAKVEVRDHQIYIGMKPGDGYNSTMFRVEIDASISKPSQNNADQHESKIKTDQSYSLMVKTGGDKLTDVLFQYSFGMSSKEMVAHDSLIPELNTFLEKNGCNEYKINTPNFLYGKCNLEENVLVMENLKHAGYQIYPKTKFLDLYHAKIAVENLAKLHAASYAYDKSYDLQKRFPRFALDDKHIQFLQSMNKQFMDVSISYLKSKVDHLDLGNKLENSKEKLLKQYTEMLNDKNSHKIMCLNHGDYWSNNFMIKYTDEDSKHEIDQLKMIDFQMMHWNTSVLDIHYMVNFSTRRDFRKEHLEEILKHYHSTFCEITSRLSVCPLDWTYEHFKKEYDRCQIYGFIRGIMVLNFAFSETGKDIKKDSYVLDESKGESEPSPLERKMAYKVLNLTENEKILNFIYNLLCYPIGQELKSGKNKLMNDLVLDIVTDADEFGLLD